MLAGFRPEQFLIITNSELREEPLEVMRRFSAFVQRPYELEHAKVVEQGLSKNSKSHDNWPEEVAAKLRDFYRPYNKALVKLLLENNFNINLHHLLKEFVAH